MEASKDGDGKIMKIQIRTICLRIIMNATNYCNDPLKFSYKQPG